LDRLRVHSNISLFNYFLYIASHLADKIIKHWRQENLDDGISQTGRKVLLLTGVVCFKE